MATLTADEIYNLTKRRRYSAQCKALERSGIRFVRRIDGFPLTTWESVNAAILGERAAPVSINLDWMHPST